MKAFNLIKQSLIITSLCLSFTVLAQKAPKKFGKINKSDLEITTCPIDSNASAYFIFDFGNTYFEYDNSVSEANKGFQIIYHRHLRIKILDNTAFDWANIEIPLYNNKNLEDVVMSIKAYTYNLENGKISKTKFDKKTIIKEKKSRYRDVAKAAMPNVKAGSVIEIEYKVKSDFLRAINTWQFQYTIPSLLSDYYMAFPEHFNYNEYQKGYLDISRTESVSTGSVTLRSHTSVLNSDPNRDKHKSGVKTNSITYRVYDKHYRIENIPALEKESYVKTLKNYFASVGFELSWTQYANQNPTYYSKSWEDINRELTTDFRFSLNIKNKAFYKDIAEIVKSQNLDGTQLMAYAFEIFKSKYNWDKTNTIYQKTNLREAYRKGKGNVADINLALVSFMDNLGLNAYPVILSTRKNGIIRENQPSVTKFNYVIAMVRLDGNEYLMDATAPLSEINILPTRCLNGKGRIIDKELPGWVNLENRSSYKRQSIFQLKIDEDFNFVGKVRYNHTQYAAYSKRNSIKSYSNEEEYIKSKQESNEDLIINDYKFTNINNIGKNLTETFDIQLENQIEDAGDLVYFNPLLIEAREENPFKIENRSYPVEFTYPTMYYESFQIEIPVGYTIESLPKSVLFSLPDNTGTYKFNIAAQGNKISVLSVFNIKKSIFSQTEYKSLKEFYNLVVAKQNEKVVLKVIQNEAL